MVQDDHSQEETFHVQPISSARQQQANSHQIQALNTKSIDLQTSSDNRFLSTNTIQNHRIFSHYRPDNLNYSITTDSHNQQTVEDSTIVQHNTILSRSHFQDSQQPIEVSNSHIDSNFQLDQDDLIRYKLDASFHHLKHHLDSKTNVNAYWDKNSIASHIEIEHSASNRIKSDNMVNPIHLIESGKELDMNTTGHSGNSHKLQDAHNKTAKVMTELHNDENEIGSNSGNSTRQVYHPSDTTALTLKNFKGEKIEDEQNMVNPRHQQADQTQRKYPRAPMYSSPTSTETKRQEELQAAIQKAKMLKSKRNFTSENDAKQFPNRRNYPNSSDSRHHEEEHSSNRSPLAKGRLPQDEDNTINVKSTHPAKSNSSTEPADVGKNSSTYQLDQSQSNQHANNSSNNKNQPSKVGLGIITDLTGREDQNNKQTDDIIQPSDDSAKKPNVADLFSVSKKKNIPSQLLTSPNRAIADANNNDDNRIIHRYSPMSPNHPTKLTAMHEKYQSIDVKSLQDSNLRHSNDSNSTGTYSRGQLKRAHTLQDSSDANNINSHEPLISSPLNHITSPNSDQIPPPIYYNNPTSPVSKSDAVCDYCCSKIIGTHNCLTIENHIMHRHCFRCFSCGRHLSRISYVYDDVEDRFYCQRCGRTNSMTNLRQISSTKINPYAGGTAPSTPSMNRIDRASKFRTRTMSNSLTDVSRRRTKDIARSLENILRSSTRSLNSMGGKNYGSRDSLASNIGKTATRHIPGRPTSDNDDDTSENDSVYTSHGIDNESEAGDNQGRIPAGVPPSRSQLSSEGENQSLQFIDLTMNDITMLYVKQARLEAQRNRLEKELYEVDGKLFQFSAYSIFI